ncbi:MAG: ChaN family lipoprotein [Planctomycetaceae bacterium]
MRRDSPRALLFLVACAGACASTTQEEGAGRRAPYEPLAGPLPAGAVVRTARETSFVSMMEEVAKAEVVYVGETHDNAWHHAVQLRVIEELYARGRLHGIGMEMFQRPFQRVLDEYVEGRIGEEEMLARTEYAKRWGFDVALYRPIWEFARSKRLPLIALNVSNEVRKKIREGGLDALHAEERRELPALYLEDAQHRAFVMEAYKGHLKPGEAVDEEKFERFYRGMCLWDDVMADGVVRWFATAPKEGQLVVLAGRGHIANRYGIPGRAFRRNGRPYATVVPLTPAERDAEPDTGSKRYADFVWMGG